MITIKEILENTDKWQKNCKARNCHDYLTEITDQENARKNLESQFQNLSMERNKINAFQEQNKFALLSSQIKKIKSEKIQIEEKLKKIYDQLPNWIHETVPIGNHEDNNQVLISFKEPYKGEFLHDSCKQYKKNIATEIIGAKFSLFSEELALLERGLNNWLLQFFISKGFNFYAVPILANEKSMYGAGKIPKFIDDMFQTSSCYLIPTGEVPLVNILKYTEDQDLITITQCFRKEAGASGSKHYGWIRQHEFSKVELVCKTDNPDDKFLELIKYQEEILTALNLIWRKVNICSGDIALSAYRQIDYEIWLPGYCKWLEVCSISDCRYYQSVRLNLKHNKQYLHTFNATGGAAGRLMAGIIETSYKNGTIYLPEILKEFCPTQFSVI